MGNYRDDINNDLKLKRKPQKILRTGRRDNESYAKAARIDVARKSRVTYKKTGKRQFLLRRIMLATNIALSLFVLTMAVKLIFLNSLSMKMFLTLSLVVAVLVFSWRLILESKSDIKQLL